MEPLPVRPTTLPQARKFTREFKAEGTRVFTEEDRIIIEMPPMPRTYLTKDARIHFRFNMEFAFQYLTVGGRSAFTHENTSLLNMFVKPLPMLDVCGPYGFFSQVEVYDYLGNTLIEKTDRHDLLAAMLSDYHFDPELDRLRPVISENQTFSSNLASSLNLGYLYSELQKDGGFPSIQTRVNGINLMDDKLSALSEPDAFLIEYNHDYDIYISTPTNEEELTIGPVQTPTWDFSIKLLNFLGTGSEKFVPLHNGFRIVLSTNKQTVPIKFSLPNGGLTFQQLIENGNVEQSWDDGLTFFTPTIKRYELSNVRLRADLLEITPETDLLVDKVVHSRMKQYYMLGKCETPTIIPGNYLSATNVKISMRHNPVIVNMNTAYLLYTSEGLTTLRDPNFSELGFRSSTNVTSCKLLFNDATIVEYKNHLEIMNGLEEGFDTTISPASFMTDKPGICNPSSNGTSGYMYPYISQSFKAAVSQFATAVPRDSEYPYTFLSGVSDINSDYYNMVYARCNTNSGKFLINFDLTLNGYSDSQIVGIDTTKAKLVVDLKRYKNDASPYVTDVFVEYDSIVTVDPGKSTFVSF